VGWERAEGSEKAGGGRGRRAVRGLRGVRERGLCERERAEGYDRVEGRWSGKRHD
jgi:hypothetical protein